MTDYQDRRREEARRRLAARQGYDAYDPYDARDAYGEAPASDAFGARGGYDGYDEPLPERTRSARTPSLRSLHQVSPEMRARYRNDEDEGQRASSRDRDGYGDRGARDDYDDRDSRSARGNRSARGAARERSRYATRHDRYDAWEDDDVTWDDGRGSAPRSSSSRNQSSRGFAQRDWNTPTVDGIGSHTMGPHGSKRSSNRQDQGGILGVFSRLGIAFWIVLGVVIVLLAIVIALVATNQGTGEVGQEGQSSSQAQSDAGSEGDGRSGAGSDSANGSASSSGSSGSQAGSSADDAAAAEGIDRAKLEDILDEETADRLIARAETSEEAKWIAQHPEAYAGDGSVVQAKLLTLAANEPAAYTYVREYPDKYPMATPANGTINTVLTGGRNIPRLYQWDAVWGYTTYSGAAFGLTGCAPTALAMVYQGFTNDTSLSPFDMAELAEEDGYMTEEEGTLSSFFPEEGRMLGLTVESIDVTEDALREALQSQQVVVVNFGPGDFTEHGHYVVLTGLTQEDEIIMNDPYSEERSNNTWNYGIIVDNALAFYAFG